MTKIEVPSPVSGTAAQGLPAAVLNLLEMGRRARNAASADELAFMLVNGSHSLTPYRQAALWWSDQGVRALSGVVQPEQNAPYVDWLKRLFSAQQTNLSGPVRIMQAELPEDLRNAWAEWLPVYGVMLPLPGRVQGAFLMARDTEWTDGELLLQQEWCHTWLHAWNARTATTHRTTWTQWRKWREWFQFKGTNRVWYQRKSSWIVVAILLFTFTPVRTTVLAPGEVVPSQPVVVRAPIEGVISKFEVTPNTTVEKGQPLFEFDAILIESRVKVAQQTLATALAQYRQTSQMALTDAKYKIELATQAGMIEEKRAELEYIKDQRKRSIVQAPADGLVLFDDPSTWIGKPLAIGERIMRIAKEGDSEVEVWLPIADAVDLQIGDPITLYLQSNPLQPVEARLQYFSHEAVQRPDGNYAYRVRGQIDAEHNARVGLKGTAKLSGRWTILSYWILRRPLAVIRTALGI
jgi:multidrug efflux pump subunit AcrA (membrane-fusion protein)